ncbi:phosphatidylethanolamine/phosphatidyl-N-methylethanolamine N-methyltransferase [Marinobacter sp. MBR-99]|jgi:phospholipid N-methyltransferase|uniref:class I SAM-dependent methyltransferase n=1 Tax=Marinobacter sp. MBR-99 TaxID=3156461 RepID=UPI003396CEAF
MDGGSGEPNVASGRRTNPAAFFRGFLREPRQVGSVIPSSRFLEQRIVEVSDLPVARRVVELGPGTGGTTRTFLRHMGADARLLSIELSPFFHDLLADITDSRFNNHLGSAEDLADILGFYDMEQPDVIISGIPFSKMPAAAAKRVAEAVNDNLAEGGRFIAYQFRREVAGVMDPIMGAHASCSLELLNIPPMRVYCWFKR